MCVCVSQSVSLLHKLVKRYTDRSIQPIFTKLGTTIEAGGPKNMLIRPVGVVAGVKWPMF